MTSTARVLFAAAALAAALDGSPGRAAAAAQRPAQVPALRPAPRPTGICRTPRSKPTCGRSPPRTPASATLVEIGRTAGGRRLWAIEIAAPGTAPPASRPGILVVANLGADQVAGSTLALGVARALLTSSDEAVAVSSPPACSTSCRGSTRTAPRRCSRRCRRRAAAT